MADQEIGVELEDRKDLGVRFEADDRAGPAGRADRLQRLLRHAALVHLLPDLAVAVDLEPQPLGEKVDDADADAVESARHLVGVAVELSAGVELGHDDLGRRAPALLVGVHRNAAPVIGHGDRLIGVDDDR